MGIIGYEDNIGFARSDILKSRGLLRWRRNFLGVNNRRIYPFEYLLCIIFACDVSGFSSNWTTVCENKTVTEFKVTLIVLGLLSDCNFGLSCVDFDIHHYIYTMPLVQLFEINVIMNKKYSGNINGN